MPHRPETPDVLRQQGLRITPQRLLILEILQHSEEHLSAEEIFKEIQPRFPSTDISTVYRTLELLTGLGLVQKVTLGESHDHYEWSEKPHHHILCLGCGAIMHFGDEILSQVRSILEERYQFKVSRAYLEVFGYCQNCLTRREGG